MATRWTKFYTTTNPIHANIIIGLLERHLIKVNQINKQDSSYLNFGEIELYCAPENVISALHHIISNHNYIYHNEE